VVIVGHSQAQGQIMRLIASKVDGTPDQAKLVSAIIMGSSVQSPDWQGCRRHVEENIPTCKSARQTGCVDLILDLPLQHPARREGDVRPRRRWHAKRSAPIRRLWAAASRPTRKPTGRPPTRRGSEGDRRFATPFVMTPGLTTTECVHEAGHVYLKATLPRKPIPTMRASTIRAMT